MFVLEVLQGTLVNGAAIVAGALVGVLIGKLIPERFNEITMQAIGLAVLLIGLQMALQTQQVLLLIFSLVLGGVAGEALKLEERLLAVGRRFGERFSNGSSSLAKGFVFATLIYGVGAMAITGAMESGLLGKHQILYAKSILDGVTAVIFAANMGIGVAFSALPIIAYQGSIALLSRVAGSFLTATVITELTAVGGILILAIGLNLLQLKEVKVGNLLPALFFNLLFVLLI